VLNVRDLRQRARVYYMRYFSAMMKRWQVEDADACAILDCASVEALRDFENAAYPNLTSDQFGRVVLLREIFDSLNDILPKEQADAWMKIPNDHEAFSGQTPLEFIVKGGKSALGTVLTLINPRRAAALRRLSSFSVSNSQHLAFAGLRQPT
jgi:hypothetical protein